MPATVASVENTDGNNPGTNASKPAAPNTTKPAPPNKRQRADSSSGESTATEKKRRKSRPKKKKNKLPPVELPSDSKDASTQPRNASDSDSDDSDLRSLVRKVKHMVTAMEKRQKNDPKVELAACIERIRASKSDAYLTYDFPTLKKPDAGGDYTHYTFKCKHCGEHVKRKIGLSETSALLGHWDRCDRKRKQRMLQDYGITGGTALPTADQTREYCALEVCENGRPHLMFKDRYLRMLFPREILKFIPHRTTITKDIKTMYRMTQRHIKTLLADIPGVFHIALDMYQSPNGFDYLGLVLFHSETVDRSIYVKRFVLECLNFHGSHTGKALANRVHSILNKFQIQDRVWGVVCDNASNNEVMMERLEQFDYARSEGPQSRVHCMLHILNLGAKAILADFVRRPSKTESAELEDDDYSEESDDDSIDGDPVDNEDPDDDGTAPSYFLDPQDDEEDEDDDSDEIFEEYFLPAIVPGSEDNKELGHIMGLAFKISSFANKLRRSPQARAEFQLICAELGLEGPYNIRRDVRTQWNATLQMLQDAERLFLALVAYQTRKKFARHRRIVKEDRKAMRLLIVLLQPLDVMSKVLSRADVPLLGNVLVYYDDLNYKYSELRCNPNILLWARICAHRAIKKFNKYYQKTDDSRLYCAAIILSPSFRIHYLRQAEWPEEWMETAVRIVEECWLKHYKPKHVEAPSNDDATSEVSYSSYMDRVCAKLDGLGSLSKELNPVQRFVYGDPGFDRSESGKSIPVNPLAWWYAQRLVGEEHQGLTQMAIDVHTTPATSVDVERAFSFVSIMVSKRRHSLGRLTVQASASLGAYSRADLVELGCLDRARKLKAKKKSKDAECRAQIEAETIDIDDDKEAEDDEEELPPATQITSTGARKASVSSQKLATGSRKASAASKK